MKAYKVLCRKSKKLFSINAINKGNPAVVRYFRNKWIFPKFKKSKLFAFDDLEMAKRFALMWRDSVVYEAEVKNPQTPKLNSLVWSNSDTSKLEYVDFWQNPEGAAWYGREVPVNTLLCDAIKIIKPIKNNQ